MLRCCKEPESLLDGRKASGNKEYKMGFWVVLGGVLLGTRESFHLTWDDHYGLQI